MSRVPNRRRIAPFAVLFVFGALGVPTNVLAQRRGDTRAASAKATSPTPPPTTKAPTKTPSTPNTQPGKTTAPPAPSDTGSAEGGRPGKPKVFDFTGLDIGGRLRTPQLLYFLERANEELERASLERRSFIPEMVRTLDEAPL